MLVKLFFQFDLERLKQKQQGKKHEYENPGHIGRFRKFPDQYLPMQKKIWGENGLSEGSHLLFLPFGQKLFSEVMGKFKVKYDLSLPDIFEIVGKIDADYGFNISNPRNPWHRVLRTPEQRRLKIGSSPLAKQLLGYMMGEYDMIAKKESSIAAKNWLNGIRRKLMAERISGNAIDNLDGDPIKIKERYNKDGSIDEKNMLAAPNADNYSDKEFPMPKVYK